MNRLRNRLILIFLAATLAPLTATLWVTASLLERSLSYSSTRQLDEVARSLEETARSYYQRAREDLKNHAASGSVKPSVFAASSVPERLREFVAAGERERFDLAQGRLDYLLRRGGEVWVYSAPVGIDLDRIGEQIREARTFIEDSQARDLRRGFTLTYVLMAASFWMISLALLMYMAFRISRPIQQLTAGLAELTAGNFGTRVKTSRDDEVGHAIWAFNHMAGQLEQNRERLVYLTQVATWQALARKMAHEVKNSLTPIRLTVEEMLARHSETDRGFLEQASQIVVDEVEALERRVRAFSEFSSEPSVRPVELDVNALVEDRVAFLRTGNPEVRYDVRLDANGPRAWADEDLVKGILTNLVQNAAEAAGAGGFVLVTSAGADSGAVIEVHDSGPGLSEQARRTLFQPTISFKQRGMGLGLSIARRSALLCGGDIVHIQSELGGAAFRIALPAVRQDQPQQELNEAYSDRG